MNLDMRYLRQGESGVGEPRRHLARKAAPQEPGVYPVAELERVGSDAPVESTTPDQPPLEQDGVVGIASLRPRLLPASQHRSPSLVRLRLVRHPRHPRP